MEKSKRVSVMRGSSSTYKIVMNQIVRFLTQQNSELVAGGTLDMRKLPDLSQLSKLMAEESGIEPFEWQ